MATERFKRRLWVLVLWAYAWGVQAGESDGRRHILFSSSAAAAARGWQAAGGIPAAVLEDGGLILRCPFTSGVERAIWDFSFTPVSLARYTSLTLDLACEQADAIRSLSVYLRRGNAWYEYEYGPLREGRQRLVIPLQGYRLVGTQQQGKPEAADTLRISPWPAMKQDAELVLYGAWLSRDRVWLVTPVAGKDAEEQAAAQRVARRISSWLQNMEIAYARVNETDFAAASLLPGSVAILCYIPRLQPCTLEAIRSLVKDGGQAIVYYSSDTNLAKLMHMRLGDYCKLPGQGAWSGYRFVSPDKLFVPVEAVYQNSWNLRPVYPAAEDASVIAWWQDSLGRLSREPAWVKSPSGWWFTHIPLADDAYYQQLALVCLLAEKLPEVQEAVARRLVAGAGEIDSFASFTEAERALRGIEEDSSRSKRDGRLPRLLQAAREHYREALACLNQREWKEAARRGLKARESLAQAYRAAMPELAPPLRGVWMRNALGGRAAWDRLCRRLAENGINAIFLLTASGGTARYQSEVLPVSDVVRSHGDQLAQCIAAARRYGIAVHAWVMTWSLEGADRSYRDAMRKQARLQVDDTGRPVDWLTPAAAENARLMVACIEELVRKYQPDGIQLDYIRYASSRADYSPAMRRGFERYLGRGVTSWPPAGKERQRYQRWKSTIIDEFVENVSRAVRSVNASVRISAAVFPDYPRCVEDVGQDWVRWLRRGWVDFVSPMTYEQSMSRFRWLVDRQIAHAGLKSLVVGIGVSAAGSELTADRVLERLVYLDRRGVRGVLLYDLDRGLLERVLPYCGLPPVQPGNR